jgi:predicted RNA-binding Zn-ribbon protein involved in translation (DUF1610 family)
MSINLNANEFYLMGGDFGSGYLRLEDGFFIKDKIAINSSRLIHCNIVKDEHITTQSGMGRIAGGIIGGALLGPIGAIGGLLSGGKKKIDQTIVMCTFDDNRTFIAETTQVDAANLQRISEINKLKKSNFKNTLDDNINVELSNQYECPECAELVKIKAKKCKHCGAELNYIKIVQVEEVKKSENNNFSKFILDYKDQVADCFFEEDDLIEEAIKKWFLYESSSKVEDNTYEIKEKLLKDFNCKNIDIDKLAYCVMHLNKVIDRCSGNMIKESHVKSVDYIDHDFMYEILIKYFSYKNEFPDLERDQIRDLIIKDWKVSNELVLDKYALGSFFRGIPSVFRINPSYLIENYLIAVNLEIRKKKVRKPKN